jgi:hypothetical protein
MVTSIKKEYRRLWWLFWPSATPYCGKIEQIEQERREKAKNHHLEKRSKKGLCKKMGSL